MWTLSLSILQLSTQSIEDHGLVRQAGRETCGSAFRSIVAFGPCGSDEETWPFRCGALAFILILILPHTQLG